MWTNGKPPFPYYYDKNTRLSGLLYCEKCGSWMRFRVGENKKQGQHWSALCYHQYKDGSKCEQCGKVMDADFFNALYDPIIHVDSNILREIELHVSRYNDTQTIIEEVKEQELKKKKPVLDNCTSHTKRK